MKAINTIVKIVVALAAVAGAVYVVATYGEKIVAWAKNLLGRDCCCKGIECDCAEAMEVPATEEVPAVEETVEEAAEEAPTVEDAVVADESDFEG